VVKQQRNQGRNKRESDSTIPWATNYYGGTGTLRRVPNDCWVRLKVPPMSEVIYSIQ